MGIELSLEGDWVLVKEKLPEVGERVETLCLKEMTFNGDEEENSSHWLDDGRGFRGIFAWKKIDVDRC